MANIESTLIRFRVGDPKSYSKHIESINKLLACKLNGGVFVPFSSIQLCYIWIK
jgi:hypothetical protein